MGIVINHSENIFLPQMIITKPEMEEKVEAFVKNGGTVQQRSVRRDTAGALQYACGSDRRRDGGPAGL